MNAPDRKLAELHINPDWAKLPIFDRSGWRTMQFGEFAESVNDRVEPSDAAEQIYVGLEHLDSDSLQVRRWGKGSDVTGTKLRFRKGDIIFGRRRAYQRKLAVAEFDGICSAHAMVVRSRPRAVLAEFLPFLMMSERFMRRAIEISVGSLSPTINWTTLKLQEFNLPSLEQQRRIAEILVASDVHQRKTEQQRTCTERYRTAFLMEALASIPERSIRFRSVRELVAARVIDSPQDGNHGELHPKAKDYVATGIPFVMANDLQGGALDLVNCKRIPEQRAKRLRIGFARAGDILLTHKGTIGLTAVVPPEVEDFVMLTPQVTYYRVLDQSVLRPLFLLATLRSESFQRTLQARAKQSTRDYMGILAQQDLPVVIPDVSIQDRIVKKLIGLAGLTGALEREREAFSVLRQCLLNKLC